MEIACHAPSTKIDSHRARYFPLGLPTLAAQDHVVRRVSSVSRFTRSSKLSNRTSPSSKRSIRGIRLQKPLRKSHATGYFNWRNGSPREHRSKTDRLEPACQKPTSDAESWAPFSPITSELPTTHSETYRDASNTPTLASLNYLSDLVRPRGM
jgi:hypothetical protein